MDEWHDVLSVNLDGAFVGSQAAARAMLATTAAGAIVNLAPTVVHRVDSNAADHRASNAGG